MPVSSADRRLIENCLAAYRSWAERCFSSAPPEVRSSLIENLGSFEPVHVPSEAVCELELTLPAPMPPLLIAYASTLSFSNLDFGSFLLPPVPSDQPMSSLAQLLQQSEFWPAGYMQFAQTVNGDPVYFDLTRRTSDGDYAVVWFNHDRVPQEAWSNRDLLLPFAEEVAPSFRAFFTALCFERESISPP